jgi:hypothetical protein
MITPISTRDHVIATLKVLAVIALIALISILISCNSPSKNASIMSRREKVVVLDSKTTNSVRDIAVTSYKVRRINEGVVTYITITGSALYEKGDTIYYSF